VCTSALLSASTSCQQVSHPVALNMESAPSDHNRVEIGDLLKSASSRYLVESVLGQGTFGTVVKCTNVADNKTVAIKMMRDHGGLASQARKEVGETCTSKCVCKTCATKRCTAVPSTVFEEMPTIQNNTNITSVCDLLCIARWKSC